MRRDQDLDGRGYRASRPQHQLNLLHAVAHYIADERGWYEFRERISGDGAGVEQGRLRLEIEVDAAAFWRTVSEVRAHASRARRRP